MLYTRNSSIQMLNTTTYKDSAHPIKKPKRNNKKTRVMSHSPFALRGKDWSKKIDDLISKFDESFRENEI